MQDMIIGSQVFHKQKIYNSLDWAKENINTAADGSIFIADVHEHTKARQGRCWIFNKDQLAVTILLKPKILTSISSKNLSLRLNQLNMAITLGILKPIHKFNIKLKWANDFYFENKKLGGILSQIIWEKNKIKGIIIGFALNINNEIPKLNQPFYKAISLKKITDKVIDKEKLFKQILKSTNLFYNKWLNLEFNEIFELWKKNQSFLNKKVTVHRKNKKKITGTFINVLENGDMLIKKKSEIIQIPLYIVENLY